MFEDNKPFETFREKLRERGVSMRCLWEAARSDDGKMDVALFRFWQIEGLPVPAIATAIVIDYGPRDGYGIWFPSPSNSIDADIDKILRWRR